MSVLEDIVYELAKHKSDVEDKVTDKSEEMIEHLIKIYIWRDTTYKGHWCGEVKGLLSSVKRLKGKGKKKYPKNKDIYKWLWRENDNKIDKMIDEAIYSAEKGLEGYENLRKPRRVDKEDIKSFVNNYMIWLSNELSKNGIVTSNEVYSTIDFLLKEHPYKLD